ncbi:glycerophosphodiester phosphodiesterase family protein [Kaarinaea lacus]
MSQNSSPHVIIPQLVAHRGFSARYPENTLLSIEQALLAGACYVECDVQLTLDHVPVLLHDTDLQRTAGTSGNVTELTFAQLKAVSAHYAARFGEQHGMVPVPSLPQLITLMEQWPQRRVFVEIKRASIRKFGADLVFDAITEVVSNIEDQAIVISFDFDIIRRVRQQTTLLTGWVIEEWNSANLARAHQLQPNYLFIDYECIPQELTTLPEANWRWVLYEIDDVATARKWIAKGAALIETNDIGGLLATPEFNKCRCDG